MPPSSRTPTCEPGDRGSFLTHRSDRGTVIGLRYGRQRYLAREASSMQSWDRHDKLKHDSDDLPSSLNPDDLHWHTRRVEGIFRRFANPRARIREGSHEPQQDFFPSKWLAPARTDRPLSTSPDVP